MTFSTIIVSTALLTGIGAAAAGDRHLVFGMKQSVVEQIYQARMERLNAHMIHIHPVRHEGYRFIDAELRFSQAHRLIGIRLSLEGKRGCERLMRDMVRRYGPPDDKDLISANYLAAWRLSATRHVRYSSFADRTDFACWQEISTGPHFR